MPRQRDHKADYARRLARAFAKGLSRAQARGHARAGEAGIRQNKPIAKEQFQQAAQYLHHQSSLTKAAKKVGISPERLRREIKQRTLFLREGSKWTFAGAYEMKVLTDGEERLTHLATQSDASLNGRHLNAAKQFVRSNDIDLLAPFVGQSVTDRSGNSYPLETDPNALHRIAATGEQFHEIYRLVI